MSSLVIAKFLSLYFASICHISIILPSCSPRLDVDGLQKGNATLNKDSSCVVCLQAWHILAKNKWSYLSQVHFVSQFVFVQWERLFICFCSETPVIYFQEVFSRSYYVMHRLIDWSCNGDCHCRSWACKWFAPKWPQYKHMLGDICVPFYIHTCTERSCGFPKSFCLFTEMYSIRFSSDDKNVILLCQGQFFLQLKCQ